MINGVAVRMLKQILDERGKVMHMLRSDSAEFESFGEIYFSTVYPAAIKAWHLHTKMVLNYAVIAGNIKLVLFDDRPDSSTRGTVQELFLGSDNYCLVTVPPGIWTGIKGISPTTAMIANCASIPHDEQEITRLDPNAPFIPYSWVRKDQ
ncbi:MAG: dTDP-4-dehydrorhamnose 3,5-epimerase family protein [Endomicrobiales bacterium]|jgi:dTDP-4-dehydrorhamnose 3,5-epimerase